MLVKHGVLHLCEPMVISQPTKWTSYLWLEKMSILQTDTAVVVSSSFVVLPIKCGGSVFGPGFRKVFVSSPVRERDKTRFAFITFLIQV